MEYQGYGAETKVLSKKSDNGDWYVEVIYTQTRSEDLLKWEKEAVRFSSVNTDLIKAMNDVQLTLGSYIKSVKGTLFSEVKKELNDQVNSDKDTKTK